MRFSHSPGESRAKVPRPAAATKRHGTGTTVTDRDGAAAGWGTNVRPRDIFVSVGRTARVVRRASRTGGRSNWAKSVLTIEETTERKKKINKNSPGNPLAVTGHANRPNHSRRPEPKHDKHVSRKNADELQTCYARNTHTHTYNIQCVCTKVVGDRQNVFRRTVWRRRRILP